MKITEINLVLLEVSMETKCSNFQSDYRAKSTPYSHIIKHLTKRSRWVRCTEKRDPKSRDTSPFSCPCPKYDHMPLEMRCDKMYVKSMCPAFPSYSIYWIFGTQILLLLKKWCEILDSVKYTYWKISTSHPSCLNSKYTVQLFTEP